MRGNGTKHSGWLGKKTANLGGRGVGTGLQTRAKLEKLGLKDMAEDLERSGLIVAERTST